MTEHSSGDDQVPAAGNGLLHRRLFLKSRLAAGAGLLYLDQALESTPATWLIWFLGINVWLTVLFTLGSGWEYVMIAIRMQSRSDEK